MKFLCIDCDEPMALKGTQGPEEGSLAVVFGCPRCGRDIALLTNPWETQLVRALGVKIGEGPAPSGPAGMIQSSLRTDCQRLGQRREGVAPGHPTAVASGEEGETAAQGGVVWTAEAERRLERIPPFVRSMARKGIEEFAKSRECREITGQVMDEAKEQFGM